jgi:hypothetical protein
VVGRRRVEQREADAGDHLCRQAEQQHAAEREPPARARRQRFVERVMTPACATRAIVEPVDERREQSLHNSTSISEVCWLSRTFTRVSPAAAGRNHLAIAVVDAAVTGTMEMLRLRILHATRHPRCVQVAERAVAVTVLVDINDGFLARLMPAIGVAIGQDGRKEACPAASQRWSRPCATCASCRSARRGRRPGEPRQPRTNHAHSDCHESRQRTAPILE